MSAPDLLIDPDGEGVYLLSYVEDGAPIYPGTLHRAASLFGVPWREVTHKTVFMRQGEGDEWFPADIGRYPYGWKLNLPRRWRPIAYTYCTPGGTATEPAKEARP